MPRDIVDAATPVCESFEYTDPDNCRPQGPAHDGLVWVSSSAARYNPVVYFLMGSGALPFEGTAALYAMRAVSALLSAMLIALAAVAVRRWARTPWPAVALVLTATPTMVYSTTVAAPNGSRSRARCSSGRHCWAWWPPPGTDDGSWRWRPSERSRWSACAVSARSGACSSW